MKTKGKTEFEAPGSAPARPRDLVRGALAIYQAARLAGDAFHEADELAKTALAVMSQAGVTYLEANLATGEDGDAPSFGAAYSEVLAKETDLELMALEVVRSQLAKGPSTDARRLGWAIHNLQSFAREADEILMASYADQIAEQSPDFVFKTLEAAATDANDAPGAEKVLGVLAAQVRPHIYGALNRRAWDDLLLLVRATSALEKPDDDGLLPTERAVVERIIGELQLIPAVPSAGSSLWQEPADKALALDLLSVIENRTRWGIWVDLVAAAKGPSMDWGIEITHGNFTAENIRLRQSRLHW